MTSSDANCIFCKIVAGDIPAEILGRTEHAISIRDLHPQAPFHALVLPLQHHENAAASAGADPAILGHSWRSPTRSPRRPATTSTASSPTPASGPDRACSTPTSTFWAARLAMTESLI